jgi:hypothetical protein
LSPSFVLHRSAFVESTLQLQRYHTDVHGQVRGDDARPRPRKATFNQQHVRLVVSMGRDDLMPIAGARGLHEAKAGFDLHSHTRHQRQQPGAHRAIRYDAVAAADYGGPTTQEAAATDVALFAQDRLQLASRSRAWRLKAGPITMVCRGSSRAIAAGWHGRPVERLGDIRRARRPGMVLRTDTAAAAAFDQFAPATDTRFAADGTTPLGPPVLFEHVTAPDPRPPAA